MKKTYLLLSSLLFTCTYAFAAPNPNGKPVIAFNGEQSMIYPKLASERSAVMIWNAPAQATRVTFDLGIAPFTIDLSPDMRNKNGGLTVPINLCAKADGGQGSAYSYSLYGADGKLLQASTFKNQSPISFCLHPR